MFSMLNIRGLLDRFAEIMGGATTLINFKLVEEAISALRDLVGSATSHAIGVFPVTTTDLVNVDGDYVDLDGNVVAEADKITYAVVNGNFDVDVNGENDFSMNVVNIRSIMSGDINLSDGSGIATVSLQPKLGVTVITPGTFAVINDVNDLTQLDGESIAIPISATPDEQANMADKGVRIVAPDENVFN